MAKQPVTRTANVVVDSAADHSYLDWAPVLGGTAVALAISAVLFNFGAGVGLAVDAPLRDEGAVWGVVAAGVWLIWVPLVSSIAGAYIAGAMRRPWAGATPQQVEFRDGAHGLVVWAVATIGAMAGAAVVSALAAIGAGEAGLAEAQAAANPETARTTAIIFGFVTAAGAALSAGAAWWAGTLGGNHRDQKVDVYQYVPGFLR